MNQTTLIPKFRFVFINSASLLHVGCKNTSQALSRICVVIIRSSVASLCGLVGAAMFFLLYLSEKVRVGQLEYLWNGINYS